MLQQQARMEVDGVPLECAGETLMQTALDGGGADNVSLIVVEA